MNTRDTRRRWTFGMPVLLLGWLASATTAVSTAEQSARKPNIVLIMSDDQGFGDFGMHGNPVIRTPNIDQFAKQGVELTHFYVCPVCAPTRSSLLTGRYNYRTRVTDTYLGRALMDPDEVTLAELLGSAGYKTGIFGKWHLGDNYPMRPIDQGFDESLVLRGGGIGQPSDPNEPGGSSYTDPILQHNGLQVKTKGYCSDVFTDAALAFIESNRDRPFFVYLPFNAPHTPLQVPDAYRDLYKDKDLSPSAFPKVGRPIPGKVDPETTARVYGMETNIDDNVGRLLKKLDDWKLAEETIVIFLTDNGPQQPRYNAGLRGQKGSVYEGGIRVPCLIRWPGRIAAGKTIDDPTAHIDLVPTILDACGVPKPERVAFDGRSLLPRLIGKANDSTERVLFFQWHRGDAPEPYRAFAARGPRWKLVQPEGTSEGPSPKNPRFQLYDLVADPYEEHDQAETHPEIVENLKQAYDNWFKDVCSTRGFDAPRVILGTPRENPTVFTRQDWRGPRAGWGPKSLGHWAVEAAAPGTYRITLDFNPPEHESIVHVKVGGSSRQARIGAKEGRFTFDAVPLKSGPSTLEAWLDLGEGQGERTVGVQYVTLERLEGR